MFINLTDNMEERLKDEHAFLSRKYPNVSFNCIDWNGKPNKGEYLFATEGYITVPQNYKLDIIKQYKGFLTSNSEFYNKYKGKYNIILTNGPLDSHNYYKLDYVKSYDERINGICAMYRIYSTGRDGDILWMREWFMNNFPANGLEKHCYGRFSWGGNMYKGFAKEANHGNHIANLEILQKYRFCWCVEPMYHYLWSVDWVTERLWNAFKCKTVPIYYGCYNIESKVPKELYIDYRDFSSLSELSDYIKNFDKNKWIDMTEKAYNWYYNECKISKLSDLEQILTNCR
jgi:hypothetical protein